MTYTPTGKFVVYHVQPTASRLVYTLKFNGLTLDAATIKAGYLNSLLRHAGADYYIVRAEEVSNG